MSNEKIYENYMKAIKMNESAYSNLKMEQEIFKQTNKQFLKSERDVKALQTIGHIVGELLKKIDDEKFIVKSSQGPRYVVGCMKNIDRKLLESGTRVALDITTLTIMKVLPREVDPMVYTMSEEKPTDISFESVGGLKEQIRELKEVIELPIKNPEIYKRVGIKAPKGVLLYGPPGTGKTLLARVVAATMDCNFLKVVASALIEKYIGESSRMIREMFAYARERAPCIIFMDEIDAIGSKRSSDSSSSDREVQRTLMELLNQLDGFKELDDVKVIMATNRPDILDPALLRPGRLDRKIEVPLPNDQARKEIIKIHTSGIEIDGDLDYDVLVKLTAGFNGADLRNVSTEAGLIAIRDDRDYATQEDFIKSARKISQSKKLETKLDYKQK